MQNLFYFIHIYFLTSLRASREEMARNAQAILPTTNPNSNVTSDKRSLVQNLQDPNPFSPPFKPNSNDSEKPNIGGPPPAYTDLQASGVSNAPYGWNTFSSPSSTVTSGGSTNVNPVSSSPYNPFQ